MRVLFTSMRMTGHLRPLLPYAAALRAHGHEVLFAAPASVEPTLRGAGHAHAPFGHPGEAPLDAIWASIADFSPETVIATGVGRIFADLNVRAALPALRETIRSFRPQLILRESQEYTAVIAGAEAGIPVVRIAVNNSHAEAAMMRHAVAPIDVLRQAARLPPDQGAAMRGAPSFTAFPRAIDGDVAATGLSVPFRVRTPKAGIDPGQPVPAWAVDDGRPLVFITFGTLAAGLERNHALFRSAVAAVADLPVRALLSTGAEIDRAVLGALPGNLAIAAWVPEGEVFPRAAALLCHAGAGTLLAGLSHGLPMVLTPISADQPDNARRAEATGAAISLLEPDAPSIRAALERALADPSIRAASGRVASELAGMPSMDLAVRELERLGANHTS